VTKKFPAVVMSIRKRNETPTNVAILYQKHVSRCVIPFVGNIKKEGSILFNEISTIAILLSIVPLEDDLVSL
jgi:hypothetical protein